MLPDQIYRLETQRRLFLLPQKLRAPYKVLRQEWLRLWLAGAQWLAKHCGLSKKDKDYMAYELIDQQKSLLLEKMDIYDVYFVVNEAETIH